MVHRKRPLRRLAKVAYAFAPALCVVALSAACGPFGYLKKVAKEASKSVADAKAVGAEEYAPYEYWGAVSYLEQAKVLMAYSEYERSFDYGERAKQLAEAAKEKAERREAGEMTETLEGGQPAGDSKPKPKADADANAEGEVGEGKAKGSLEVGGSVGGDK